VSTNPFNTAGVQLHVFIDGVPLLPQSALLISNITVESQLFLPSLCEIELVDSSQGVLVENGLIAGVLIEVRAVSGEDIIGVPIFSGQVESIELRFDHTSGVRSVVRAYDLAHRMLHGRKTTGFPLSLYSEVVEGIGIEHGIATTAEPTEVPYTMVVQSNESDWDFIVRLAREVGYVTYISIDPAAGLPTLYWGLMAPAETAPPPLGVEMSPRAIVIGDDGLISLRATVSGSGLTASASTRGWDQSLAIPAIGEGPAISDAAANVLLPVELATELGGPTAQMVTLERLAENEAATEAASVGLGFRLAGSYSNIEAIVQGNPFIMPNTAISISKAGVLTGEYTVTAAVHTFEPRSFGYRTSISCAGYEDRTLMGLQGAAESSFKLNGVYPAIVTDVEDPEFLGRVLLSFPWLSETFISNWARVVQAGAGEGLGMQILPEPTDEVLVAFENGQLDSPYVLGGLYSADRLGAVPAAELVIGTPMIRAFTSREGHQLLFNDNPETSSLTLQTTFGASCIVRLSPETGISISTIEGQPITVNSDAEVTINSEGAVLINSSEVTVSGKGAVAINGADVSITAEGAIEISTEGVVSLTGSEINLASEGSVSIEADVISLVAGEINIAGGIVSLGA
jgi:hypothetical protein